MILGKIKPTHVKLRRDRLRYRLYNVPFNQTLLVIAFDFKSVLVSDLKGLTVWVVLWKDLETVQFEQIVHISSPSKPS